MIKTKITSLYPNHNITSLNEDVYVADYTEKTKVLPIHQRRSVEVFSPTPPIDNESFKLKNNNKLDIDNVIFDNTSFVDLNGNPLSQCESCSFPSRSSKDSWILFIELKYSNKEHNNEKNLRKAIKQLVNTRSYYHKNNVLTSNHKCFLLASLPLQSEPFANFTLTPDLILRIKTKFNFTLRFNNSAEVYNHNILIV